MKKIFLVFALMLCNLFSSDAQTWTQTTSVKTPCGATVSDTWVVTGNTGFSVAEIAYWKNEVANFGATYLQDPTWTYNCHGYAWHMKPNNASAVWIGRSLSTAHNIYWHSTNGGYVEVAESSATHVDYDSPPKDPLNPGNHSAIRESQYLYVSKWGQGPLVRHAPYATLPQFKPLEQKKFYARTSYTVTFNMNGAPGSITSQSVPKCGTATKPSPDPGWSGYTFGGWYIESSCINAYNFTSSVTSNLTLYSKWTQTVPHINFYLKVVVQNSSSYSLSNLQVKMKGKVDTDPNFTQFIDISKSSLSSGASVPSTDGPTFSLPQSTNINNMTFEFKASGSSGNLKVLVAVDSPSSLFIYNLLGSLQSFSFAPGSSTTASNGYRTMTVVISNN